MTNVLAGNKLINIGTMERPVLVPESVTLCDGSDQEREWWNALVSGSVTLPDEVLNKLLSRKTTDAEKNK